MKMSFVNAVMNPACVASPQFRLPSFTCVNQNLQVVFEYLIITKLISHIDIE